MSLNASASFQADGYRLLRVSNNADTGGHWRTLGDTGGHWGTLGDTGGSEADAWQIRCLPPIRHADFSVARGGGDKTNKKDGAKLGSVFHSSWRRIFYL